MKRMLSILLASAMVFGNFNIASAEDIVTQNEFNNSKMPIYENNPDVETYGLIEFITGYVGGKLVDFMLSEISGTSYTKIVTRNGIKYCVIYAGNPWGISPDSYRVYTK